MCQRHFAKVFTIFGEDPNLQLRDYNKLEMNAKWKNQSAAHKRINTFCEPMMPVCKDQLKFISCIPLHCGVKAPLTQSVSGAFTEYFELGAIFR